MAREFGLALLVDATFASPINFRPLEHGADVVITSATKYLNGHSDVIAGAVAGSASFVEEVNRLMRAAGARRSTRTPRGWWTAGMRTLAVRMERHNANGARGGALGGERMPRSPRSTIPGLADHPDHELAAQVLDGFGGMVGLELAGGHQGGASGCSRGSSWSPTRRASPAWRRWSPSRGSPRTRASSPSSARRSAFPDGFLRLSCGIEDAEDIIADLAEALGKG